MKNYTIKDQLPIQMRALTTAEQNVAKKNNIPMFRGVLYENLDDGYGNPILKKVSENTVVLGGAILALEHLCNVTANFKPATINQIYSINQDVAGSNSASYISLFGLGTGGATLDFGSVTAKDIKARNIPGLVPIRVGEDITGTDAGKYYMRTMNEDMTTYSWYLKEFSDTVTITSLWKDSVEADVDGSEIISDVSESDRTEGIETFAEIKITLNVNDVRDYFESIGELDMARYNTLGIYTGNKVNISAGYDDYVNVRLFAYTNFNNRDLTQKTEAIYTYRIYSLV